MFETYIIAANLGAATAERKRAILLHSLGHEGQRLFYTLPDPAPIDDDKVYLKVLRALDGHYLPKVNVVAERYKFRQRSQFRGETIEDFVAALRQLVVTCGWNCAACSNADENMRDQIIEKTNSEQIRERLLLEENPNQDA